MADHPTVTTPGGSDIFAGLASLDYATFNDESMALLVDNNLAAGQNTHSAQQQHNGHANGAANGSTSGSVTAATSTEMKSGLTPGGGDAFLMTPRTAGFMAELAVGTPANQRQTSTTMLFDHDLVANGSGGNGGGGGVETVGEEDDEDGDALRQDDLPTPLTFSFTPTGGASGSGPSSTGSLGMMGARYHVAAAHKHKRVRSNPDMLQNLNFQQLLGSHHTNNSSSTNQGSASASPLRPSVESHSLPTTPMDSSGAMPEPLPISIGTVNVVTPVGFHGSLSPIRHGNRNGNGSGIADDAGEEHDAFPSDMDSFLKEMQWSELAENNNSMNVDTLSSLGGAPSASSAGYLSQRIQAGMNELKMKRKRPTQHMRHHSNPVDLLHNLDQFRLLSQQQQQSSQQPHISPPHSPPVQQYPSPTKLDDMGTGMTLGMAMNMGMNMDAGMSMGMDMGAANHMGMPMAMQQQHQPMMQPHMQAGLMMQQQPNAYGMPQQQDMQFQVPNQIANGTARSLHSRRSSMPNSAFSRGSSARGHRAPRGGSTGLSMDMSQMNLEFLTLPEDQFQQKLHEQQVFQQAMGLSGPAGATGVYASPPTSPPLQQYPHQNSPPQRGGAGTSKQLSAAAAAAAAIEESNRKSYKCGRCGQPKVGHVCTMPDLRNNWTQADLEITKGTKLVRTNCHIVATKTKWVTLHEDNL